LSLLSLCFHFSKVYFHFLLSCSFGKYVEATFTNTTIKWVVAQRQSQPPIPVTPYVIHGEQKQVDDYLQALSTKGMPVILINRTTKQMYMANPKDVLQWRSAEDAASSSTKRRSSSDPSSMHPRNLPH